MKGEKASLWAKTKHPGAPDGKLEGDMGHAGKGGMADITVKDGSGSEPGGEAKAAYKKMEPTIKDSGSDMGGTKSKSAKAGAYEGEMGSGTDKLSPMAQKVGKPRKGY